MELVHKELMIRERAYWLWEQEGRPDGREWDHWERAREEIDCRPPATASGSPINLEAATPKRRGRKPGKGKAHFTHS